MRLHAENLKALCERDLSDLSPFQVRIRFERHLYGLASDYSNAVFGSSPSGLTREHLVHFCRSVVVRDRDLAPGEVRCLKTLEAVSDLYQEFTRFCDTSNWSDDGQDPRVNRCRTRLLGLCDLVMGVASSGDERTLTVDVTN